MKCSEILEQLERLAPLSLACEWDNPGLLAGRRDKEVEKVFLALDATDEVISEAAAWGAGLLLTHHPLIFKPVKKVNDDDFVTRRILNLIRQDLSYYAMHTNFDAAPGCMADLAADRLGLKDRKVLEITAEDENGPCGIGKTGYLPSFMTLQELAERVKQAFSLSFVTVYGFGQIQEPVRFVAVSPGAGGSMIGCGIRSGAQVFITGDIGHHNGIDAAACGMAVIDAGHYGLEHIFMEFMEKYLKETFGDRLLVRKADLKNPVSVI